MKAGDLVRVQTLSGTRLGILLAPYFCKGMGSIQWRAKMFDIAGEVVVCPSDCEVVSEGR